MLPHYITRHSGATAGLAPPTPDMGKLWLEYGDWRANVPNADDRLTHMPQCHFFVAGPCQEGGEPGQDVDERIS
jgi:hypothetical protein